MKITSKTIEVNSESFGPELHVTVVIPLEYCVDAQSKVGEEEFARTFGTDLLNLIVDTPLTTKIL